MNLKEWQVPPKWLLVQDFDDLFHVWWENHCYQGVQDQNIMALETNLNSLVRGKVALEEHVCSLEMREEVMWGLVDSIMRTGEAQSNQLDFLQHLANTFIGCAMEWDSGGGGHHVPSEPVGSLGLGYVPSSSSRSSPPPLNSFSELTSWSRLVSPITLFSKSGRPIMIEEEDVISSGEVQAALSSVPDSVFEEFGDTGLPLNGGSDGNMGGKAGIQRGT